MMRFQVSLPTEQLLDCRVEKFIGDGRNGEFCLLPRHVDFVTALRAGVSSFVNEESVERFLAHSEGLLVKSARRVSVVVQHALVGDCLEDLRQVVAEHFLAIDDLERSAVASVARLEADFVRRYLELEKRQDV